MSRWSMVERCKQDKNLSFLCEYFTCGRNFMSSGVLKSLSSWRSALVVSISQGINIEDIFRWSEHPPGFCFCCTSHPASAPDNWSSVVHLESEKLTKRSHQERHQSALWGWIRDGGWRERRKKKCRTELRLHGIVTHFTAFVVCKIFFRVNFTLENSVVFLIFWLHYRIMIKLWCFIVDWSADQSAQLLPFPWKLPSSFFFAKSLFHKCDFSN